LVRRTHCGRRRNGPAATDRISRETLMALRDNNDIRRQTTLTRGDDPNYNRTFERLAWAIGEVQIWPRDAQLKASFAIDGTGREYTWQEVRDAGSVGWPIARVTETARR